MIFGVGIDLVDVSRMERVLQGRSAKRFIDRVFTEEEIVTCTTAPHPAQAYSARFAAKEAVVKALGTGFSRGITPGQIAVVGGERTRPTIRLAGSALRQAQTMRVSAIHLSLTHTPQSAAAMVVLEN
ncbi:MAG: holo-ACP synthase [Desulfomonile tiedjei]|nr:holo-ACP synthase [Desulfomonile tiedjei]